MKKKSHVTVPHELSSFILMQSWKSWRPRTEPSQLLLHFLAIRKVLVIIFHLLSLLLNTLRCRDLLFPVIRGLLRKTHLFMLWCIKQLYRTGITSSCQKPWKKLTGEWTVAMEAHLVRLLSATMRWLLVAITWFSITLTQLHMLK
jgi:hypothetical protein